MVGDFDPTTKRWWYPDRTQYPAELLTELDKQFTAYDTDLLARVTASNKLSLTISCISWGTGNYACEVVVKEGTGMARAHGILSKYVDVSTSNEETMLDTLREAAEGFKKGNPATKITNLYRPSLTRAMELGVRDIKWSMTLYGEKFCKSLSKRGCDELNALVTEDRFAKPVNPNYSGTLVSTLFTAVVSLCDQLKEDNNTVTPKDFWEAYPYQSSLNRIGAKYAQVQEEDEDEEWLPSKAAKRNKRKAKNKAEKKGDAPEVASANLAKGKGAGGNSGNKGAKGASGPSQARAKGGRGKQAGTQTKKVMCDSKNCTHKINPRREVPNPLLCAPCTKWQEDNHYRFGDFYLNKQWQQRPFVSKNGPSEDHPRGRKKARYSYEERDRPSRKSSENATSVTPRGTAPVWRLRSPKRCSRHCGQISHSAIALALAHDRQIVPIVALGGITPATKIVRRSTGAATMTMP